MSKPPDLANSGDWHKLTPGGRKVPILGGGRKVRMSAVPQGKPDHSCEVLPGVRRYVVTDKQLADAIAGLCMAAGMIGDNTTELDTSRPPVQPDAITIHLHNSHGVDTAKRGENALLVDVYLRGWSEDAPVELVPCATCDGKGWVGHVENACTTCWGEGELPG
jgi:hypothetical protein